MENTRKPDLPEDNDRQETREQDAKMRSWGPGDQPGSLILPDRGTLPTRAGDAELLEAGGGVLAGRVTRIWGVVLDEIPEPASLNGSTLTRRTYERNTKFSTSNGSAEAEAILLS